jgi:hypothetical protein
VSGKLLARTVCLQEIYDVEINLLEGVFTRLKKHTNHDGSQDVSALINLNIPLFKYSCKDCLIFSGELFVINPYKFLSQFTVSATFYLTNVMELYSAS